MYRQTFEPTEYDRISSTAIEKILNSQRIFFATHQTKDIEFRLQQLKKFKSSILKYKKNITDALWLDLHKSPEEAYLTEISIVLQEIDCHINHLRKWAKPQKVGSPIELLFSKSRIYYEPLGVALIMAPWNYPFQLLMNSLVGAISAGCCAILKSSPYSPATAKVMEEIITGAFAENYIAITHGNREVNRILLEQRFDIIFFTGSPDLGKTVMNAASKHLTPVVLELGGKSPCIVDKDANLNIAAKRIAWGKTINAGQTCIAPDYLFIHSSVKEHFVEKYKDAITGMFGKDCKQSKYYARIVNQKAMERLQKLMQHGDIIFGGNIDEQERYIAPTLIDNVKPDYPVMQEEIFGPILPIMTFDDIENVINYVNSHEKPLAFYYFGKDKSAKNILYKTTSGGGCVNDTLMHIVNHNLPFGGVGHSGMGKYHGKESFLAFSNKRAIVISPVWFDVAMKYAPFSKLKIKN
ncbi:MAG: aldehyde dehydrogenase [Prevotellaceae bacterium]|jgi:aldehyde dehydrogenase (NAD+)|nr:aldehyde dehydrogenase [Prevotellaceae bacterium]